MKLSHVTDIRQAPNISPLVAETVISLGCMLGLVLFLLYAKDWFVTKISIKEVDKVKSLISLRARYSVTPSVFHRGGKVWSKRYV